MCAKIIIAARQPPPARTSPSPAAAPPQIASAGTSAAYATAVWTEASADGGGGGGGTNWQRPQAGVSEHGAAGELWRWEQAAAYRRRSGQRSRAFGASCESGGRRRSAAGTAARSAEALRSRPAPRPDRSLRGDTRAVEQLELTRC